MPTDDSKEAKNIKSMTPRQHSSLATDIFALQVSSQPLACMQVKIRSREPEAQLLCEKSVRGVKLTDATFATWFVEEAVNETGSVAG